MSVDPNMAPSAAFVQITIGQVYSEVTGMRQEVRDLTHSVHAAVGQLGDHETRLRVIERDGATQDDLKDHGTRLASLERKVYGYSGAAAAVSLGGGWLIAYLMKAR